MTSEFAHSLSHIKHEYLENGGISLQKMSLIFVMIDHLKNKRLTEAAVIPLAL